MMADGCGLSSLARLEQTMRAECPHVERDERTERWVDSFCYPDSKEYMARLKRTGKMETFSVSVSSETKTRLRKAALRSFGGNVSALIEAVALEADRQDAIEWLIRHAAPIEATAFEAFMKEMAAPKKKRASRAA